MNTGQKRRLSNHNKSTDDIVLLKYLKEINQVSNYYELV